MAEIKSIEVTPEKIQQAERYVADVFECPKPTAKLVVEQLISILRSEELKRES